MDYISWPISRRRYRDTPNPISSHTISKASQGPSRLHTPSKIAQPPIVPLSPLFSCRPIHILKSSGRGASESLHCSSQLDRRRSPWIRLHRTPCRTPRRTIGRAQAGQISSLKLIIDYPPIVRGPASAQLRQPPPRAGGFSLQMARMKEVSARRHRKVSPLQ